jgi:hypothetical protein
LVGHGPGLIQKGLFYDRLALNRQRPRVAFSIALGGQTSAGVKTALLSHFFWALQRLEHGATANAGSAIKKPINTSAQAGMNFAIQ